MKNKKIKKQVFFIEAKPYRQECIVVVNGQFSDAVRCLKKLNNKHSKEILEYIEKEKEHYPDDYVIGGGDAYLYTKLPRGYVMLLSSNDSWVQMSVDVYHECLHLTFRILRNAGLEVSEETEEAFTYLQADLASQILRKIF